MGPIPGMPQTSQFSQTQAEVAGPGPTPGQDQLQQAEAMKAEAEQMKAENEALKAQLDVTKQETKREGLGQKLMAEKVKQLQMRVQALRSKSDQLNQGLGLASPASSGVSEGPPADNMMA